jgi:hypothetical protein
MTLQTQDHTHAQLEQRFDFGIVRRMGEDHRTSSKHFINVSGKSQARDRRY